MWSVNRVATSCFDAVFSVMESWPGLLSLTVLAVVTAFIAMLAYKYTSNQRAIGHVHDEIKANLLAIKLFKDNLSVTFRSQFRLMWAAVRVFLYSLQPLAVMIVPMVLLICQMAQRYEWRAYRPGEEMILSVALDLGTEKDVDISLELPDGIESEVGPNRIYDRNKRREVTRNGVVWRLRAVDPGVYMLRILVGDETVEKELVVSDQHYARVSPIRPGSGFWETLLYPVEAPAAAVATIQAVQLDYHPNSTPLLGLDLHWLIAYFIISMLLGLIMMPIMKVQMW